MAKSKSKSAAQTQHTISTNAMRDAYFAQRAIEQTRSMPTERSLQVAMKYELIAQFQQRFGMSDAQARAEAEMEMSRLYPPNPWDAPGGAGRGLPRWRSRAEERTSEGEREQDQGEEAGKGDELSDEQWDLFERRVGYK